MIQEMKTFIHSDSRADIRSGGWLRILPKHNKEKDVRWWYTRFSYLLTYPMVSPI